MKGRRERVYASYLSGLHPETISETENISLSTVYDDIKACQAKLANEKLDIPLMRKEILERINRQVDEIVQEINDPQVYPATKAKLRRMIVEIYLKMFDKFLPDLSYEESVQRIEVIWDDGIKGKSPTDNHKLQST